MNELQNNLTYVIKELLPGNSSFYNRMRSMDLNEEESEVKKFFSIFLITIMCFSLCACSSEEESADDTGKSNTEQGDIEQADYEQDPFVMPEFSAIDLQGNTVTEEIFSQVDLTVVNFWATYCGPCINELPELGEWSESMADNVQIIGIIVDVGSEESDEYTLAQQIVEQTGAGYLHLAAAEEFDDIISELIGVPTTFFVDKNGDIVGEPIVGADVDGYKKFVEEYFDGQQ